MQQQLTEAPDNNNASPAGSSATLSSACEGANQDEGMPGGNGDDARGTSWSYWYNSQQPWDEWQGKKDQVWEWESSNTWGESGGWAPQDWSSWWGNNRGGSSGHGYNDWGYGYAGHGWGQSWQPYKQQAWEPKPSETKPQIWKQTSWYAALNRGTTADMPSITTPETKPITSSPPAKANQDEKGPNVNEKAALKLAEEEEEKTEEKNMSLKKKSRARYMRFYRGVTGRVASNQLVLTFPHPCRQDSTRAPRLRLCSLAKQRRSRAAAPVVQIS